jgi:hypothetical protein
VAELDDTVKRCIYRRQQSNWRFIENVKGVRSADIRDPEWRRVGEYDRSFARAPRDLTESEYGDLSAWYYWKRHAA